MAMSKSRISYSKVYDLNIRNIGTIKSRISCIFPKPIDRKSTRLNSSHDQISYAVFCLKKKIEVEGGCVWLPVMISIGAFAERITLSRDRRQHGQLSGGTTCYTAQLVGCNECAPS